jgi:uncharacterized protein (DUF983 family)
MASLDCLCPDTHLFHGFKAIVQGIEQCPPELHAADVASDDG